MRILVFAALMATLFAGCFGEDETVRIAFVTKDTALEPHEDPEQLAKWIEDQTGRKAEVFLFTESNTALQAVASGQADIASVDGAAAWLAWQRLGLEAVASEVRGDGRTFYHAAAWVLADSEIQTVEDLAGKNSCHTGATKSAGMMMPMSYLASQGLVNPDDYADDISQVQEMAKDFFGVATIGGAYAGYEGALRCLSDGTGDVAFVRDTTPQDYCAEAAESWCLDLSAYRRLVVFGPVPEHPFMVNPDADSAMIADVVDSLVALKDSEEGRTILDNLFGTGEIRPVTTEEHLGEYGALIALLPGIEAYVGSK